MIIDDASPDETGEIADRLAAEDKRIKVLHRTKRQGLGSAYKDGFSVVSIILGGIGFTLFPLWVITSVIWTIILRLMGKV